MQIRVQIRARARARVCVCRVYTATHETSSYSFSYTRSVCKIPSCTGLHDKNCGPGGTGDNRGESSRGKGLGSYFITLNKSLALPVRPRYTRATQTAAPARGDGREQGRVESGKGLGSYFILH